MISVRLLIENGEHLKFFPKDRTVFVFSGVVFVYKYYLVSFVAFVFLMRTAVLGMQSAANEQTKTGTDKLNKVTTKSWVDDYIENRVNDYKKQGVLKKTNVFTGDSLIELGQWNQIFDGRAVVNRGVSGIRIEQLQESGLFDFFNADNKLVVLVGINNFWQGQPYDEIQKHMKEFLSYLSKKRFRNVSVISLLPVSHKDILQRNNEIVAINKILKKLCHDFNFGFVNIHSRFLKEGKLNNDYTTDGVHLNHKGYQFLGKLLESVVTSK